MVSPSLGLILMQPAREASWLPVSLQEMDSVLRHGFWPVIVGIEDLKLAIRFGMLVGCVASPHWDGLTFRALLSHNVYVSVDR
jgi:hypothetical protein